MENIYQIVVPIITAVLTGVVGPLILRYINLNTKSETKQTKDGDKDEMLTTDSDFKIKRRSDKIDTQIKDQLDEIKDVLDADRSWIVEFHDKQDGGQSSVEDLKKFSMVYESVSPGVSEEKKNFENLLVSFFIETFKKIIREKELYYEDVSEVENNEIREMFKQKGNTSMYMFAMETIDDILVGILGVDYTKKRKRLTEREKLYLKKQAYSLAGYLQNRDFDN